MNRKHLFPPNVASLLLGLFIPQMATTAKAQFTDDNWVIGTPATAPACCIGEVHALVKGPDGDGPSLTPPRQLRLREYSLPLSGLASVFRMHG